MKKIKKNYIISIILLLIVIIGQGKSMAKDVERHFQTDYEYKMFFGKWEVTEFMGKGQYCYGEKQEAFIGSTVYYDNSKIQINEVTVLKRPTYQFGIIPNDKHSIYTQIYPAEGSDVLWGREEGYFVHVQLRQNVTEEGDFFEFGDKFYIVDENTIILDTEDGWYKMKRLDYIDGYPQNIQSI